MKKEEFIKNIKEAIYYIGCELKKSELEYLNSILPDEMDQWSFKDYYELACEIKNEGLKDALHNFDLIDDDEPDEEEIYDIISDQVSIYPRSDCSEDIYIYNDVAYVGENGYNDMVKQIKEDYELLQ